MSQDTTVLNAEHEAVRNQEGLLDIDVSSSPPEDHPTSLDLYSDSISLPHHIPVPPPPRKSLRVRNKPRRLIEEL